MTEPIKDTTGALFVAGVPRSGTHILAHLVGRHSRYFMIPREVRFHSDHEGVTGFLHGQLSGEQLLETLESYWWKRPTPWNPDQHWGLYRTIAREDFDAGLAAFAALHEIDPVAAARGLVAAMLDPLAARAGKPAWIEHTPGRNGISAPELISMFPDARFVHMVRDGRDRACSVNALPWGAESVPEAIRKWGIWLAEIDAALRSLPAGRCMLMQLEDLVLFDRDPSYRRLLDFLELEDEPAMREFFDVEMNAEKAHVGRWRSEVPDDEQAEVETVYRETLARLEADGVSCLPPERDLVASYPVKESEPPNPFDPWADRQGADL